MAALVRLEWQKDSKGYDLREVPERERPAEWEGSILEDDGSPLPACTAIIPRGGRPLTYLVDGQVLWDLVNTPRTPEGVQGFVNRWGLLHTRKSNFGTRVEDYNGPIHNLGIALDLAVDRNWPGLERYLAKVEKQQHVGPMRPRFARVPGETMPRLFIQPDNLTSYCWIELMQVVAAEATIQRCLNCGAFFPRGIEKGTRNTRQYCSDRCRVAMHRRGKRKN
jgi:hypothetical protein